MERLQALGDPRPNGIVASGQVVGAVGVETLHPGPRAAHATALSRLRHIGRPVGRVRGVRGPERGAEAVRVRLGPVGEPADPPGRLQSGHGAHRVGAGQPVSRGEGAALRIDRVVPDHQGVPDVSGASRVGFGAPGDDREAGGWLPAELLTDRDAIGRAKLTHGAGDSIEAWAGRAGRPADRSAALVLDRALHVDQALLALTHEALQLLLELGVAAPAPVDAWLRILQGLDREVDLAVLLDRDDLGL